MKTKVSISFDAEKIPGDAATTLVPTNCGPDVANVHDFTILGARTISVRIKLDKTDERVPEVLALLQQHGVEVESFSYDEYSEEDRQKARLLLVGPSVHGEDITISSLGGTRYDLTNACPNCQTGAKQTSPAYLTEYDKKKIRKHRAILASYHSLIVDGGMRKKLVDAGVTGISFGDVRMRQENNK